MSFATGLFSFLGGASQQFRDEIDLANSYKIQQASLKAEQEKELAKQKEEEETKKEIEFKKELKFTKERQLKIAQKKNKK